MEDSSSFGPTVVVAVGLEEAAIESLREECSSHQYRLIVAARQADLPLSLQCDYAIVATLLSDADGRKLAREFVTAGAQALLIDNAGAVPLHDSWSIGAKTSTADATPADWLEQLADGGSIETVSRAGKLMEALRLADAVQAAATLSGATGVPVSFVRIRPRGEDREGIEETLDRLTSVVGMTTVFHDPPNGERMALVVNGDRRRLAKLLDDSDLAATTDIAVVEVSPDDNLRALIGRSLLALRKTANGDVRTRVLVAVDPGQDKTLEAIRLALHRMDMAPLFWDASFDFDDARSNPPAAAIVDLRSESIDTASVVAAASAEEPPVPVIAVSDADGMDSVAAALATGVVDFVLFPFETGEVQAALARTMTVGSQMLKARAAVAASVMGKPEQELVEEPEAEHEVAETAAMDSQPESEPPHVVDAKDEPVATEPAEEPVDVGSSVLEEAPTEAVEEEEPAAVEEEPVAEEPVAEEEVVSQEEPVEVESLFADSVSRLLVAGEDVKLEGLGVLKVRHETSRIIHDEHGRTIVEPPKRSVAFTAQDGRDGS